MSELNYNPGKILLVGDVMRDVLVAPEGELRKGSDRKARIEIKPGGSAANQAVWLAANSVPCKLVARVGSNDFVDLENQFIRAGVEPQFIADTNRTTGVLVSMISPDGERSFYTDRGANEALCLDDMPKDVLDDVSLILLSGYSFFVPGPRGLVRELMRQARAQNISVAIDPASAGFIKDVGVRNFLEWTRGASFLFPNAEEAALLSGKEIHLEQLHALEENYGRVILKCGAEGVRAQGPDDTLLYVPARHVDVVDTTGAGDAFVAGFLAKYLVGADLEPCMQNGVEQGANAVAHLGGQPI